MRKIFALAMSLMSMPAMACDLALVLAVDVSGSVDKHEYRLQMDGLAAALRDPLISEALVRGQAQVMLLQWTGTSRQRVTLPWTKMRNFQTVENFAAAVSADVRVWRNYSTAIGEALIAALEQFPTERRCKRRLIDVSGDGISNEGVPPGELRARLGNARIVVNALAIEESEPDLTAYFFENLIFGDGAFVVSAATFEEYPAKIRLKLLREVTRQTADAR